MKSKIFFAITLLIVAFSSCIGPKQTNLLQNIEKNYPQDEFTPPDYKIIQGDQLFIRLYTLDESMKDLFAAFMRNNEGSNEGDRVASLGGASGSGATTSSASRGPLSSTPINVLTVSPSGTIKIPYIGDVYVLDMTTLEANKVIADKFEDFSPNVKVEVNLQNRYFFVLGALGAKPIRMPHLSMTIFQALAQTGDMSIYGDRKKVKILRQTATGTVIKVFDIRSKDIVNSDYYYIQPNDVIYVPQLNRKFFGGITSFTGIFGMLTTFGGLGLTIWALVDKSK